MKLSNTKFVKQFSGERKCVEYLFQMRFANFICDKCRRKHSFSENPNKRCFTCSCGQTHLYPKQGTIFENSKIPLMKWFHAMKFLCENTEATAKMLQSEIHVSYITALRLRKKILHICPHSRKEIKNFEDLLAHTIP